jgi:hypothetical protein
MRLGRIVISIKGMIVDDVVVMVMITLMMTAILLVRADLRAVVGIDSRL